MEVLCIPFVSFFFTKKAVIANVGALNLSRRLSFTQYLSTDYTEHVPLIYSELEKHKANIRVGTQTMIAQ